MRTGAPASSGHSVVVLCGHVAEATRRGGPYTLVSFHAHPDDETLLTGGLLARVAAEGHRVVLVTATSGELGLAADADGLGTRRERELRAAAEDLGVARVELLGYRDSGLVGTPPEGAFCSVPVEAAARRLAEILRDESAQILTIYDEQGGYGHRDHVQVHRVGVRAADLAGTPVVLEATVDRAALRRGLRLLRMFRVRLDSDTSARGSYSARELITHRVDVRAHYPRVRRALRRHASQMSGGAGWRTVGLLARLPAPVGRRVLGTQWLIERGRLATGTPLDDIFTTLREGTL